MFKIFVIAVGLFVFSQVSYARFDPTRPPYYRDTTGETIRQSDLAVTAIIISKDRKVAVINNEVLKVGDEISGLKIVDIDANQVRFFGHDGYFSVSLRESIK